MTNRQVGRRTVDVSAASSSLDTKVGAEEEYAASASEFANVKRAFLFPSQDPQSWTMAEDQGQSGLSEFWYAGAAQAKGQSEQSRRSKRIQGSQDFVGQFRRGAVKTGARVVVLRRNKRRTMRVEKGKGGRGRIVCQKERGGYPWRVAEPRS